MGDNVNVEAKARRGVHTNLVFLRLELAVTSLLCKRLALRRDGCKTLRTDILDDGGDETRWCGHSDRDVSLLVSARGSI